MKKFCIINNLISSLVINVIVATLQINLHPNEYITSVKGHYGYYMVFNVVKSLTFVTNLQTYGPYGREEGIPFHLPAHDGKIIGFHGRSGKLVDAIGTYVKFD